MIRRTVINRTFFRVPVIAAGTLSFWLVSVSVDVSHASSLQLATEFFAEGNWEQCRVECRRSIADGSHDAGIHLLNALAERRCGIDSTPTLRLLCADDGLEREQLALAHYELALAQRASPEAAFPHALEAFRAESTPDLFARSGLLLADIIDERPDLAHDTPGLVTELLACRPLWTRDMYRKLDGKAGDPTSRWSGKPGEWLIAFYRSQIRPTIANRCTLEPSCSEYMRRALRKHGALGFAIYGDRGVREPEVVSTQQDPVIRDGRTRYRDPLHDHDWWLKQ